MAQYMILKQNGAGWEAGRVVQADTAAELRETVKEGYDGDGRYAIVRWDNRREFDLRPGAVEATEQPPA